MKNLARALAFVLALLPAVAAAQTFPTVPSGTVIGRTAIGTGPAQAIPITTLIASMLNPLTVTSVNTASVIYRGSTSGTATVSAQAVAGTPVIKWPTTSGTVPTTATLPIVLDAVTGNLTCPTCMLSLTTRTAAAALDLTSYSVVRTMGYATAGDGGGAMFKKVGSNPFRDSFVTAVSITGNGTSGCTNGTYRNKMPSGGTGTNLILNLVASGNVVTSASIEEAGGNGYTAADVLTTTVTGCAANVTLSVTTVSTPSGSFTDAAGNHWQITPDEGNWINIRQFGAKVDYAGTDGSATNDFTAIQNAINYAADIRSPTIDGGGAAGTRVILPAGNSMICGGVPLNVPQGVAIEGANMWASTIKICAAWGSSANFMNICDPDTRASCFASYLRNFTLYAPFTLDGSSGVSAIYSNSIQQVDIIDRVAVYAGRRRCLTLEQGYGGAALLGIQNFECTPGDTSTVNTGILIDYGTTLVTMRNVHVETGGPNTMSGMTILGGFVHLSGFHTEGISTGIEVNITGTIADGFAKLEDLTGGAHCTNLVLKQGGSVNNSVYVSSATQNGCTNSINDEGAATTTFIGAWTLY
jgi:hypothetical protein